VDEFESFNCRESSFRQISQSTYGTEAGARAGYSIDLSLHGILLAIGAPWTSSGGTVVVYELDDNGAWVELGSALTASASVSLSVDCNALAVGSPDVIRCSQSSGSVSVYRLDESRD
jgi:ABC-type Fe2+-enterobactin transport system substrate-binding protein